MSGTPEGEKRGFQERDHEVQRRIDETRAAVGPNAWPRVEALIGELIDLYGLAINITGCSAIAELRRPAHRTREHSTCRICNATVDTEHRHVVDVVARRLFCACTACWMTIDGMSHATLRAVPPRSEIVEIEGAAYVDAKSCMMPRHGRIREAAEVHLVNGRYRYYYPDEVELISGGAAI